ncbi:hypothetical protein V5799_024058 [Amblyomma americanum]|uniref:G-protein coupled receptors family 1 profile domain-containing protein n=1 Tax=Amblyomma americanum TaxID=6943 RepID=A0AAQ4ED46_AMBAM
MKSLMITVVIVAAFIVCWTPYYCMMVILIFLEPDDQLTEELQAGIFFFGSSTAMINPLIYGIFHLRRQRPLRRSRQFNSSAASRAVNNSVLLPGSLNKTAPVEPTAEGDPGQKRLRRVTRAHARNQLRTIEASASLNDG